MSSLNDRMPGLWPDVPMDAATAPAPPLPEVAAAISQAFPIDATLQAGWPVGSIQDPAVADAISTAFE